MMECTTGLTDDEFDGLLAWLREEGVEGYPPILGLSGSLRATLMYLRQNIVQAVIGEILEGYSGCVLGHFWEVI